MKKKSMPNQQQQKTQVKTKVPVAVKISLVVMMLAGISLAAGMILILFEKPQDKVVTTKESSFTVTLQAGDYSISEPDEHGYQGITMDGFGNISEPGEPALPTQVFQVLMPPGTKFTSLEIISSDTSAIAGDFLIKEAPTPQLITDLDYGLIEVVPPKQEIYQSNNIYPENIIEIGNSGKMRKYLIQQIKFNSIQYKPLSGELNLIEEITIKINYEQEHEVSEELLRDKLMDLEAKELFFNYNQFKEDYFLERDNTFSKGSTYNYVIIAPQEIESSQGMTNLVNYRQNQGYSVHVETTENIDLIPSGSDFPEKVRNYLAENYVEWGFKYVTLVGTHNAIPMKYCYWMYYNEEDIYIPTDYYYQDLTGIWNSEEVYCGEEADFYPELYVGRIPLDDPSEFESYVNKLISFEESDDPYKEKALLIAGIWVEGNDAANTAEYLSENVFLPNEYQMTKLYEETGDCPVTIPHDYDASHANVVNHWKDDYYGIVYLVSHGNPGRFCSKPCPQPDQGCQSLFINTDANQLSNEYPSIVFGHACSTADPENPDNLGYSLIKNGAVAYLGNTSLGYASDSIYKFYFDNLVNKFQNSGKAVGEAKLSLSINGNRREPLYLNLYGETLLNLHDYGFWIIKDQKACYNAEGDSVIEIEGTSFGNGFDHYILEWKKEGDSLWSGVGITLEDGGNQQKFEELLGIWDISETEPGAYDLKLTGYIGTETYTDSITLNVNNCFVFGEAGSGDGQFFGPGGIKIYNNEIYVTDVYNRRIQVFDLGGNFLRKWGEAGSGNGQFAAPTWITIYNDEVYVADFVDFLKYNHIQVFDLEGNFLRKWEVVYPTGIEIYNEKVYVGHYTPWGKSEIFVYSLAGDFLDYFPGVSKINGIDVYGNEIYATDNADKSIKVFDLEGNFLRDWGGEGSEDGQFSSMGDVKIENDEVYVSDGGNNRIQVFDLEGNFLKKWGEEGHLFGQFKDPRGIDFRNNDVYVADFGNNRVQIFNLSECGDVDASGNVDIDDIVYLVEYIFAGGPAPIPYEAGDVNLQEGIDIDDIVYLVEYIFGGGPEPCNPPKDYKVGGHENMNEKDVYDYIEEVQTQEE